VVILGIFGVGEFCMNKNFVQVKNERLYVAIRKDSIFKQILMLLEERKKTNAFFYMFPHVG